MSLGLGLEHSCPWPREGLSSERLSLALASSLVSSTPPLLVIVNNRNWLDASPPLLLNDRYSLSIRMSLRNLLVSNSSKCSAGSSASSSTPAFAASWPMSKPKFDANDLGVDDSKQVRLQAYFIRIFGARIWCFGASLYQSSDWSEYSISLDASFCFACPNFESKAERRVKTIRENIFVRKPAVFVF